MVQLMPILVRLLSIVEPLTPRAVSYYVSRVLRSWKNNQLIIDYQVRTKRLGRFHYKVYVDMYLTPKQASRVLQKLFQAFKRR